MSASLAFADPVDLVLKYWRPSRPDVAFGSKVPTTREATSPSQLVVLRRVGGTVERVTDNPRLDVLVWHESEFDAHALAQALRVDLLYDLPGRVVDGHTVYSVSDVAGPASYPDPAGSDQPIVLFTVQVGIRGAST